MDAKIRCCVESSLSSSDTLKEWEIATRQARYKLERIINQFGDGGGERNKPWYLAQITAEIMSANRLSAISHELMKASSLTKQQLEQIIGKPVSEDTGNPKDLTLLYHIFKKLQ